MENKQEDVKVIKIYSSYTPAQKRAQRKWNDNNKEKVNEMARNHYRKLMEDPEKIERRRAQAREYARKRNQLLKENKEINLIN